MSLSGKALVGIAALGLLVGGPALWDHFQHTDRERVEGWLSSYEGTEYRRGLGAYDAAEGIAQRDYVCSGAGRDNTITASSSAARAAGDLSSLASGSGLPAELSSLLTDIWNTRFDFYKNACLPTQSRNFSDDQSREQDSIWTWISDHSLDTIDDWGNLAALLGI